MRLSFGLFLATIGTTHGFAPIRYPSSSTTTTTTASTSKTILSPVVPSTASSFSPFTTRTTKLWQAKDDNNDDDDDKKENPYQDENFPELEFIDYSDPDYMYDQGSLIEEQMEDEEKIEEMREERRRRNDEFQFETYHAEILQNGREFNGEWTVYKTSTFLDGMEGDGTGAPRLVKVKKPLKVKTRGYKITVENDSEFRVDKSRLCHEETVQGEPSSPEDEQQRADMKSYCPKEMSAFDFRGKQGNMCVGSNAYTLCNSLPLLPETTNVLDYEGPFSELYTEVGISEDDLRMRVKLEFAVLDTDKTDDSVVPPLHLKSLIVCRETADVWPKNSNEMPVPYADMTKSESLFGTPGAEGGLYDPPPVGSEEQASQYMMVDLEGGATLLFPFLINQDPEAFGGKGWVTSLDWTPYSMRFQVDRKVQSGVKLMELRSLELSEVQSADASTYRPSDGGADMRQ